MVGLTTHTSTKSNELKIKIPNELRGIDLQVIVLPANQTQSDIDFFTDNGEPTKEQILQGLSLSIKQLNLVKKGKLKARNARELINEL